MTEHTTKATDYVYLFDEIKGEPDAFLLGNKGAQLAEMIKIGLPVPPGFTITTQACIEYYQKNKTWPAHLKEQVQAKLEAVEKRMGKKLGDPENPLLFSVRSGSYVSMPGMMDTVLNLGLNDKSVQGLAKKTGNERGAYDSYSRFIQMFGDVVMGVEHHKFMHAIDHMKEHKGVQFDTDLDANDLKKLVEEFKQIVREGAGKDFPNDPWTQLEMSINAVFMSWNAKRAVSYRRINKLRDDAGTAVNCQVMVFGNMGEDCATGVAFTRDPSTGENKFYGEYLTNAQGEDVVAGIRTPKLISQLEKEMPAVYKELAAVFEKLERHYHEMQDMEFTIENGKLYMLQTRTGKRTAQAAVKIAVDMEKEGMIDKKTAVRRVKPEQLDQLLHKQIDPIAKQKTAPIAKGLPASPGAAVGKIAFTAERATELAAAGEKIILVRLETSPEDIEGMHVSQGILTARGGMTSHAAVVARGMGKSCVAGCADIKVDEGKRQFTAKDKIYKEGDWITLDGSLGEVFGGQVPVIDPELKGEFKILMSWADEIRKLGVWANADTPHDAQVARSFGAEGIGLCRTEHMFFEGDRIKAVREMILADNLDGRKKALAKLLPMQRGDFEGIFKAMAGLPVTIRLLDPPLHEFLPKEEHDIKVLAQEMGVSVEKLNHTISSLHEFNPMLGFRGVRLGMIYPEIFEMQARAILEAAVECKKAGVDVKPEIMIPVVALAQEMKFQSELVRRIAEEVLTSANTKISYHVGVMIELPRAALIADKIAEHAEFFSFGTNDLTQTSFGFSRDDAGKFIPTYVEKGWLKDDPFQVLDQEGVGQLIQMAVAKGKSARKDIKIGICGEHGGEPSSVEFCHRSGLNYVSCSPFRVPIARLAAAHAVLKEQKK